MFFWYYLIDLQSVRLRQNHKKSTLGRFKEPE